VLIYKKKTGVLILTMLPGILHAGLSGLHLYPFALRLVLYLSVPTIIVVGYGFEYFFFQFFKMLKIDHWQPIAIIFSVIPVLLFFQNPFPIKLNGQTIIVDGRAGRAFKFYQDINFITTRLPIKFEKPLNQADSAAIKKFVAQSGKNWILFTGGDQSGNRKFLKEIEELGCKRLDKFITSGSMAFLYDFGK
jgi:hypothetical protein